MISVQQQQLIECLGQHRIDLVRLGRDAERHAQEVIDEAQGVVGVQVRLTNGLLVGVGRDGRHLGEQTDRGNLDLLGVERIQ